MARVTHGPSSKKRTKKILKRAKGFRAGRGNLHKMAAETVNRALYFSYRDRKAKKRTFRNLWNLQINALARQNGITYSKLIHGLKLKKIELDRKVLSELAKEHPDIFVKILEETRLVKK